MSAQEIEKRTKIICMKDVTKDYSYYKKEEGIKGSIKNLFFREKLTKRAVDNMNVSIYAGEIVGLIGLNGAGKTTSLKMMSGLISPTEGKIEVLGYTPFDKKKDFLRQISMVMGNKSQLWWDLPAIESFELNHKIYSIPKQIYKDNLEEMTALLDIEDLIHTQVRRLSLGERMKMEIVASLIHNLKIIFLDEPTIGLDVVSQYKIRDFLKKYNRIHNATILLTSHNFNDIISLCDRLLILNEGRIIFDDKFAEFSKKFSSEKIVTLQLKHNAEMLKSIENIGLLDNAVIEQDILKFHIKDNEISDLLEVLKNYELNHIEDIQIQNISMDEIICRIYQK